MIKTCSSVIGQLFDNTVLVSTDIGADNDPSEHIFFSNLHFNLNRKRAQMQLEFSLLLYAKYNFGLFQKIKKKSCSINLRLIFFNVRHREQLVPAVPGLSRLQLRQKNCGLVNRI